MKGMMCRILRLQVDFETEEIPLLGNHQDFVLIIKATKRRQTKKLSIYCQKVSERDIKWLSNI